MYVNVLNEIIISFQFHLEKQSFKYNLNKWGKMAQEKKGKYLFHIFLDANFCVATESLLPLLELTQVLYRRFGTCW